MAKDDFLDYLANKQEQKELQKIEQKAAQARFEEEKRIALQREEELGPKKTLAAATIFEFARKFQKDELCERIKKVYGDSRVYIFGGGWAHEVPYKTDFGCWSRLEADEKRIKYWSGYKWMGAGEVHYFDSPRQLERLAHDYLDKCASEIKSGKIFERIEKWYRRS